MLVKGATGVQSTDLWGYCRMYTSHMCKPLINIHEKFEFPNQWNGCFLLYLGITMKPLLDITHPNITHPDNPHPDNPHPEITHLGLRSPSFESCGVLYISPPDTSSMQILILQGLQQKLQKSCSRCNKNTWHVESSYIL